MVNMDIEKLSDAEIRTKLLEFGFPVFPITPSTRSVMVKKLKLLMDNKNKINSDGSRRSLGRYSSEEESDSDVKVTKRKDNRRFTMAVPPMQPPSSTVTLRKSVKASNAEPVSNISSTPPRKPDFSSAVHSTTTTTTTTNRSQKILKTALDEFDTGSDSESDVVTNNYSAGSGGFSRMSKSSTYLDDEVPSSGETSFSSRTLPSYRPSLASNYANDTLNEIRARLKLNSPTSRYSMVEKPYTSTSNLEKNTETPYLNNFTKRLSNLSPRAEFDYKNDVIKEQDTNGGSGYARSHLAGLRSARGRDSYASYRINKNNFLKNNFVSFAVLAGAALFFIFLAIMYLGMRSDTSIVPAGTQIPYCSLTDPMSKRGINCIDEEEVKSAIQLLHVIRPELLKRSIANQCHQPTVKPHISEIEIVNFVKTNYALKDEIKIKTDLQNLELLTFQNPEWGIKIIQTNNDKDPISEENVVENMENLIFNKASKLTSLVIFHPELPWKCMFFIKFSMAFNSLMFIFSIIALIYSINVIYKKYKLHVQKQKEEVGFMVEKIIDILQTNAGEENEEKFVVINHVRDMILPVSDRIKKEKNWAKAVKFINENESRVRTEVQVVQGEPFEVWRWIGSANLNTSRNVTTTHQVDGRERRIVNVHYFLEKVLNFPHKKLRFCKNSHVEIKGESQEGFLSKFALVCKNCYREYEVCSEDPNFEYMNINLSFVAGIVSLQLKLHHLNEICKFLHIPGITEEYYEKYLEEIYGLNDSRESFEMNVSTTSNPKKETFMKQLKKSRRELENLQKSTIEQRNSTLWYEERRIRLTASNFGKICNLLPKTDKLNVARNILNSNFKGNVYTKYGCENEQLALENFEKITNFKVVKCGLFIHYNYQFLAASPDGLINEINAIIEIKCPYNGQGSTPELAVKNNKIKYLFFEKDGALKLKRSHPYYYQVQGQLFVTGRDCCYFVVWTPLGLVYEKIEKDEEFFEEVMLPKLEEFYFEYMLPLILENN